MLTDFTQKIYLLSMIYPFSVISWIRSHKRNKAVHGHPISRHILGLAVDVILDNASDTEAFCKEVKRMGLKYKVYKTHIHVQTP